MVGIPKITSCTHISARILFRAIYRFYSHSESFKEFKPCRNTNVFARFCCWKFVDFHYSRESKHCVCHCSIISFSISNCIKVVMRNGHLAIRWISMELKSNVNIHFIRFGSVTLCEAAQSRNSVEFVQMEKLHQFTLNLWNVRMLGLVCSLLFCSLRMRWYVSLKLMNENPQIFSKIFP